MLPDQGDATDDDGGDCDYERVETRDLVTAERETKVHCGLLYYCIDIV